MAFCTAGYCTVIYAALNRIGDINIFSTKIKRILVNKISLFVEFNICIILYVRYILYFMFIMCTLYLIQD